MKLLCKPAFGVALLATVALLLAAATFVEHAISTAAAQRWIYFNPVLFVIYVLAMVNMVCLLVRGGYFRLRKAGMLLMHLSFAVILAGAWITHTFGCEGYIHLREGESTDRMTFHDREERRLPFRVTLERFTIERYPGSQAPSSFRSDLTIESNGVTKMETLAMNRIVKQNGFRLYQSSYDPDEHGSILSVNYDPVGAPLSYTGYFMIFAATVLILFGRGSRFWQLRRQLRGGAVVLVALMILPGAGFPQNDSPPTPPPALHPMTIANVMPPAEHAARFGRVVVQSPQGRMEPLNTYSANLMRKISHRPSYKGFNSDQMLVSLLVLPPHAWMNEKFIYQPDPVLAREVGVEEGNLSFSQLAGRGVEERLSKLVDAAFARDPGRRSATDKSVIKLEERLSVVMELLNGRMLRLFPCEGDTTGRWYSAGDDLSKFRGMDSTFVNDIFGWYREEALNSLHSGDWSEPDRIVDMIARYQQLRSTVPLPDRRRVDAEILYNRLGIFDKSAAGYALVAVLLLAVSIVSLLKPRHRLLHLSGWVLVAAFAFIFVAHSFGIGLRWYVSGQPPWSNSYETMVFVAWSAALAGLCFARRRHLITALAGMLAGAVLLVAHLNFIDPQITPLVPVLKSPWLMVHVATVTSGYALLGLSFLLGALSLFIMAFSRQSLAGQLGALRTINEMSLITGLCLMVCGTFIGAIWANESWGRYWGWDPKETWALVSVLVYAVVLHARFVRRLQGDFAFSVMTVFAFSSILMTWFGVNYYLSGLHSYGGGDTLPAFWVVGVVFLLLAAVAVRARARV